MTIPNNPVHDMTIPNNPDHDMTIPNGPENDMTISNGPEHDKTESVRHGKRPKRHDLRIESDVPGIHESTRKFIRRVIRTALQAEGVDFACEVDVLITHDDEIRRLNREQRGVDRVTDVLSFPAFALSPGQLPLPDEDADPESGRVPLGDMAISLERVTEQAREYGHSPRRELAYLVTHSTLHLLGYDHLDEGAQKALMREHEERILTALGLSR